MDVYFFIFVLYRGFSGIRSHFRVARGIIYDVVVFVVVVVVVVVL